MRRWFPFSTINRWISVVLLLLTLALTLFFGLQLAQVFAQPADEWPIDLALYARVLLFIALFTISGALAYRVVAAFTLSYDLDRNGLYINWMGNRAVVPLDQISHLDIGLDKNLARWSAWSDIGYHSGQRRLDEQRVIHRFATVPNERSLVIHTADALYAISPRDTEAFVQDLEQRRNLGATKSVDSAVEPGRMFLYAFWHDRVARSLLLVALVINLVVLGVLAWRYPTLNAMIEMRYNATGEVTEFAPRSDVLFLPMAALLITLVNTGLGLLLYRLQPIAAYLLQGASVVIQLLFAVAILTVIL